MTIKPKALTNEQMTETLYSLAEEIFLLCAILTRRKLAHGFCDLAAHIQQLDSRVMPCNSSYSAADVVTPHAAEISVYLDINDSLADDANQHKYEEAAKEMEIYISYLDLLIAKDKPVMCEQMVAA
jgi:hypothetical protein